MAIKKIKVGNTEHELQTTVANITDLDATAAELNYMQGAESNIQLQINDYAQMLDNCMEMQEDFNADLASLFNADYDLREDIAVLQTNKADKSHTHNYAASSSAGGSATSAVKLQTARTIGLGTGATGTATSFNGSANITIPVTDVKESYVSWGGKNLSGSISPIDAACSNIHSANRFAFAKAAGITIEYSRDGSTWSTYDTTDSAKVSLVSGIGSTYYIGSRSTSTTVNDKLRITLNATNMGLYTRLRKLLINISTSYSTGSNVIIEKAMKGSETTFSTVGTYAISGWSGWNSIPIESAFGGGSNQTGNIAALRLTFGITGVNAEQTSNALTILDIVGIGDTYWSTPSTMAKTGHIYLYDGMQNAIFPSSVVATNINSGGFAGAGVATVDEVKTYLGI